MESYNDCGLGMLIFIKKTSTTQTSTLQNPNILPSLKQGDLANAPPASHDLTKNILRYLALVMGPAEGRLETGLTTASLVHTSVGGSSRNIVQDELIGGKVRAIFQACENELLDYCARVKALGLFLLSSEKCLPLNWNISTLATFPTGTLIVSSIRTFFDDSGEMVTELSTVCIPASGTIHDSQVGCHSDIMFPFDKIMERSQKQLHGMTEEVQDKQYDKDMSRR